MTAQTNRKIPQIRFKGFEGEWDYLELRSISEIKTGPFGSALHASDYVQDGIPIVTTEHFKNWFLPDSKNGLPQVSVNDYERLKSYALKCDDLVFSRVGSIDINACVGKKQSGWLFSGRVLRVRSKAEFNSQYLHYELSTWRVRRSISTRSVGQTMPCINTGILGATSIIAPKNHAEQIRIGAYFQNLDQLLSLHQRKHDKLVALKKAMLQKMFPQPGGTTPEIRFKGFSEKWVQKRLSDLADRFDNLRHPISANNRVSGETPYYGANGIQDYVNGFTHEGEFILVAEDGANDLSNYPIQYVTGKIWVNNHAHVLQGRREVTNNKFLRYALSQVNMKALVVGGGRAKLNAETMMQMELRIPSNIDEQKKIGNYFCTLDELIAQHATQLQKLQQIKSACLEKMFV